MSPEAQFPEPPTRAEYEASADKLADLSRLVVRFEAEDAGLSLEEGAILFTEHKIRHSKLRTARLEAMREQDN